MLRYNIIGNEVVVLTPERHIAVVPNQDKIDYFTIDGKRYERANGWFASVEADGAYALLHSRVKKQGGDDIEDRQIVHTIKTSDQYFLRTPEGKLIKVSSLKDLCRACPEYADQLKALKKGKKLKFKGKSRERDLAQCVNLINTFCQTYDMEDKTAKPVDTKQLYMPVSIDMEGVPDSIFFFNNSPGIISCISYIQH